MQVPVLYLATKEDVIAPLGPAKQYLLVTEVLAAQARADRRHPTRIRARIGTAVVQQQ